MSADKGAQLPTDATKVAEPPPSATSPESGVTLLELLEREAIYREAHHEHLDGFTSARGDNRVAIAHLRAARERLESEMRDAEKYEGNSLHADVAIVVLRRINGGGPHGR